MKSKFATFIMTIISILIVLILIVFGIIIYEEASKPTIADKVENFVSNYTVVTGGKKENIETPEIIESTSVSNELETTNIDYTNTSINKYFYNQIEEKSKKIYNALYTNKEKMKTGTYQINLGTEISDLLSQDNGEKMLGQYYQSAIEAYIYDNPDVFYIEPTKMYLNKETTTKINKTTYNVFINSGNQTNYLSTEFSSEKQINAALNEIEKIKNYFAQNKKVDTYENIKMVHDYLIESIDYDESISENYIYNIYGALINKKCVCEGYAKAFKYLMDAMNIENTLVIGKGTNSEGKTENHAWNYVKINNKWYAVDCTWDDPIIIGGGKIDNSSKYKYFLKGENEFNQTHTPEGQFTEGGKVFTYPVLSKNNYQ